LSETIVLHSYVLMRESVEINRNQMIERKEKNEKTACIYIIYTV